jgi:hypothetical protein
MAVAALARIAVFRLLGGIASQYQFEDCVKVKLK